LAATSTGLHIVRKRLKSGERFYVYAARGGPCILVQDGARPVIDRKLLDKAAEALRHSAPGDNIDALLDAYRASPAFTDRAPATQLDYRLWLNRISSRFGKVPIRLIPELRAEILLWRDELADTPRAADRGVKMLQTVLRWALDRGLVTDNPARDMRSLHRSNRADLIWEPRHWKAVADVPPAVHRVLELGKLTGLRQSDLLRLSWEHVGKLDIELTAQKTHSRVVIPIYPELRKALGKRGSGAVLRNMSGKPWTPSGFRTAWQRARPEGFDRTFHDLRGTFVTTLAERGFSDQELAYFTGWTTEKVAAIRQRYVDRARVARKMARRIGRKN
jgi:integrase